MPWTAYSKSAGITYGHLHDKAAPPARAPVNA